MSAPAAPAPLLAAPVSDAERRSLVRLGQRLTYAALAYNTVECLVALASAVAAGSIALFGFGADSVVELAAGLTALWRLHHEHDVHRRAHAEHRSVRVIGWCFLLIGAWVAADAVRALVRHERPDGSLSGMILTVVSLLVMPQLARAKRRVAARLRSGALHAAAGQTALCAWLSAATLAGLVLNALFGWWWADPAAALVMVPIIMHEGLENARGRSACGCAHGD